MRHSHRLVTLIHARFITKRKFFFSGEPVDIDPAVSDCVLLAAGRNHSAHIARGPAPREICAVYYDTGHV